MEDPRVKMMKITEELVREIAIETLKTETQTTHTAKWQSKKDFGLLTAEKLEISLDHALDLISFVSHLYAKYTPEDEIITRARLFFIFTV